MHIKFFGKYSSKVFIRTCIQERLETSLKLEKNTKYYLLDKAINAE